MLMYENFISKLFEKKPQVKLAIAFVNFFNTMMPGLKFSYSTLLYDITMDSSVEITMNNNGRLQKIMTIHKFFKDEYWLKLYHMNLPIDQRYNYVYFIYDIYDIQQKIDDDDNMFIIFATIDVKSSESKIPGIIGKLTEENFKNSMMKKDSEKYNL